MYNILLIPNITWQKNINQDSYVQVISEIIKELSKIRSDLYWHCPLPEHSSLLDLPNVKQYNIKLPSYPNSMRGHFNYFDWLKIVDWKNKDIDLIYSHLPEWTTNIVNLINNVTDLRDVPVIGYCHWFEIKEITNYIKNYLLNNINGILEMKECGVNTLYQKKLVLENVKDIYSKQIMEKLDDIIKVHYLGINKNLCVDDINYNPEKVIVFNHRPQTYKNFPYFMELMDKLYDIRQDFKVWIPLLNKSSKPYVDTTSTEDKKEYYNKLKNCLVGYAPKQKYGGWSIAVTDGLMNGVPYLFYDESYYRELTCDKVGNFHKTDEEAIKFFEKVLDDKEYRNNLAKRSLRYSKEILSWENRIRPINDAINEALEGIKLVTNRSKKKDEIVKYIEEKENVSKSDILKKFGWGVGIPFSPYRQYIRTTGKVKLKVVEENLIGYNVTKDIYARIV